MGTFQVIWKSGDGPKYKDGMMIDLFDKSDSGWYVKDKNAKPEMPHDEHIHYYITTHDSSEKETLKAGLQEIGHKIIKTVRTTPMGIITYYDLDTTDKDYRASSIMIDKQKAKQISGDELINEKVNQKGRYVAAIDCTGGKVIHKTITLETKFKPLTDNNSVSVGNYTIGAGGGYSYLNHVTFIADIAATMTGDLTGTLKSDVTQTAKAQMSFSLGFLGYTFTLNSDTLPGGVPFGGWTVTHNNSDHGFQPQPSGGGSFFVMKDFNVTRGVAGAAGKFLVRFTIADTKATTTMSNMFLDGAGLNGGGIVLVNTGLNISAVSIRGCTDDGICVLTVGQTKTITNILIEGCGGAGFDGNNDSGMTCSHIASGNNIGNDFQNMTGVTKLDLMSSDNTADGTSPHIDKNFSLEFYLNPALATYAQARVDGTEGSLNGITLMEQIPQVNEIGPKVREAPLSSGTIIPNLMNSYRQRRVT